MQHGLKINQREVELICTGVGHSFAWRRYAASTPYSWPAFRSPTLTDE